MAKKINEKTAGISLAGFVPRTSEQGTAASPANSTPVDQPPPRDPAKAFTGAGIFMSAITGKDELAKDLAQAQAQLAAANRSAERFVGAELVRALDPKLVKPSRWANRSEASLKSRDFEKLKVEIDNAGGNVQPIKVRTSVRSPGEYEIVFGHRRHRACLELNIPVRALIAEVGDAELFAEMDRENRQRADLRPYEQGLIYAKALDEALFPSLRKMADALGVDVGNASKAISLARLPSVVLNAFESPLDLLQAWATPLSTALQRSPDLVLERARALSKVTPRLTPAKVFVELLHGGVVSNNAPTLAPLVIKGKGGKTGKIDFNSKAKRFEISLTGLDADQLHLVEKAVKALLS
jgi:ParB family chromosome partitioning protein